MMVYLCVMVCLLGLCADNYTLDGCMIEYLIVVRVSSVLKL